MKNISEEDKKLIIECLRNESNDRLSRLEESYFRIKCLANDLDKGLLVIGKCNDKTISLE